MISTPKSTYLKEKSKLSTFLRQSFLFAIKVGLYQKLGPNSQTKLCTLIQHSSLSLCLAYLRARIWQAKSILAPKSFLVRFGVHFFIAALVDSGQLQTAWKRSRWIGREVLVALACKHDF